VAAPKALGEKENAKRVGPGRIRADEEKGTKCILAVFVW
jgi:hypothetical protein